MLEADLLDIAAHTAEAALTGRSEPDILAAFGEALCRQGMRLAQLDVIIDTLHPTHEGHVFKWYRDKAAPQPIEYPASSGEQLESWRKSPWFSMLESGESLLRRRLHEHVGREFATLGAHHADGRTDYVAVINRFSAAGTIGEMDCVYSSWTSDHADGFDEAQLAAIRRLSPFLAHAIKTVTLTRIAGTLARTYLGRDAGRRVLTGRINRGVAERIEAVLWFSDLRGYTRLSESIGPEQVLPMLNDYAEVVIAAIHDQGGDVLKLIGDGILAIFPVARAAASCDAALKAAAAARGGVVGLNARRSSAGLAVTDIYLALHVGPVYYGNVGGNDRLDFTVVGPAVNEVSRISAMCRSVDQSVLLSSAFVEAAGQPSERFASVGRFALRGVKRAQELFTLDAEA